MNKSASLAELDKLQSIHPFTNLRKHEEKGPVVMTRGRGIYVYDDQGKESIEGMAGLWCASLGFSDERLIAAATRQLNTLPYYHGFAHKTSDVAVRAAADLLALAPGRMARVFLGTSGSDANDTAIKLVRYYNNALGRPAKKKIIARTKGYHGVSVAAATLTGLPHLHTGFDLPGPDVVRADCPHHYRFAQVGEGEEAFAARLARQLQAQIEKEGPENIAAFIAEPVMGAGGVIPPPAGYFDLVQPILKHYNILLIADEVICGFGRTGRMWGSQTYDMEPDIVTCAKALTGGYVPFSATMVSERVYQPIAEQSARIGMFGELVSSWLPD
jgi:4-aminobutyrate--pyruvate transaminase